MYDAEYFVGILWYYLKQLSSKVGLQRIKRNDVSSLVVLHIFFPWNKFVYRCEKRWLKIDAEWDWYVNYFKVNVISKPTSLKLFLAHSCWCNALVNNSGTLGWTERNKELVHNLLKRQKRCKRSFYNYIVWQGVQQLLVYSMITKVVVAKEVYLQSVFTIALIWTPSL